MGFHDPLVCEVAYTAADAGRLRHAPGSYGGARTAVLGPVLACSF